MIDLNALAIVIGPLAAAAPTPGDTASKPNILQALLPLILIFFVFYFLIIRPQSKVDDDVKLTFVKSGIARIETPAAESGKQD
jgi:preprotein translocase subunit YajC